MNLLQSFLFFLYFASVSKYHPQVYLDNWVYKIVNTEMLDHTDDNLFEYNEN